MNSKAEIPKEELLSLMRGAITLATNMEGFSEKDIAEGLERVPEMKDKILELTRQLLGWLAVNDELTFLSYLERVMMAGIIFGYGLAKLEEKYKKEGESEENKE